MGKKEELSYSRIPVRKWRRNDGNRKSTLGSENCRQEPSNPVKIDNRIARKRMIPPPQTIPCKTLKEKKKTCNLTVEKVGRLHLSQQSQHQQLTGTEKDTAAPILLFGNMVTSQLRLALETVLPPPPK